MKKPIDYIGLLGDRPSPMEREKADLIIAHIREIILKHNIKIVIPESKTAQGRRLLDRHLPRDLWEVLANG